MPWPNPFGTSAAGGGKNEVTFGGPILLGKIKEGGVAGIGPLISPSGALLVQSTGALTNQVVSTGAPSKGAFLYSPVSTGSLITAGPPPYTGYGTAIALIDGSTADRHFEVYSTSEGDWIRFAAASTQVGPFSTVAGASSFAINGTWPEIAVFTSPGGEIGGYTDLNWVETSRLLTIGASTAIFTGIGEHVDNYSIGGFNVFHATTSAAGDILFAVQIGDGNEIDDCSDTYTFGQRNHITGGGGPSYSIGRDNVITAGAVNYIYGDLNSIDSTGGNNYVLGGLNTLGGGGNSNMIVGLNMEIQSTSGPTLILGVPVIISTSGTGYASTHEKGTYIVLTCEYEGYSGKPNTQSLLYSQNLGGTVWGQSGILQTSSAASIRMEAASTADQNGASLGVYSAGSAGTTGSGSVRLLTLGSTGTIPFRFYESTVGNYVGLIAPSTMPNLSYNITLPASPPAATGQPLVATTAGVGSFAAGITGTITTSFATITVVGGIITAQT